MFNIRLVNLKALPIMLSRTQLRYISTNLNRNRSLLFRMQSCACGQLCTKTSRQVIGLLNKVRLHSTQSDQHRQKVILEATSPKMVIDKLEELEKVLPEKKNIKDRGRTFWMEKIDPYVKLARWDRPIGVYLLYWPCAWSLALGSLPGDVSGVASLHAAALCLAGAALMRGAGCTINDMWDKDIDRQVERTKDRPLVSGRVSSRQALGFLALQLSLALGVLLQFNCYTVVLGASSMLLVVMYPLAKRFTNYPQIFLGATFNWGALVGYSAIQGSVKPEVCLPLYAGALAWTVVYDTIYAHQDKLDDARIGMKSTALTFGARTKPALAGALGASVAGLAAAGAAAHLAWPYAAALAATAAHVGRQIYTLDPENPSDCADKFKSNAWIGLIVLLGILGGGYDQYFSNRQKNKGKEKVDATNSCFFS